MCVCVCVRACVLVEEGKNLFCVLHLPNYDTGDMTCTKMLLAVYILFDGLITESHLRSNDNIIVYLVFTS